MKAHKTTLLPVRSNRQIKEYVDAFNKGGILVMYSGQGWRVISPDGSKSREFAKQRAAIAEAKRGLAEDKGDLFIFDKSSRLVLRRPQASLHGIFNRLRLQAFFHKIGFHWNSLRARGAKD